jgi:hypothetical protein
MLVSFGRKLRSAKLSKLFYSFILFFPFVFNVLKKFMTMAGHLSEYEYFTGKQVGIMGFFFFFFFFFSDFTGRWLGVS